MMGHKFGLGFNALGKLRQDLGNPLMGLLPRALQERLIGGLLDEGVLEGVLVLREEPRLVEELGRREVCQPMMRSMGAANTACTGVGTCKLSTGLAS
jgi:hypothetical protein